MRLLLGTGGSWPLALMVLSAGSGRICLYGALGILDVPEPVHDVVDSEMIVQHTVAPETLEMSAPVDIAENLRHPGPESRSRPVIGSFDLHLPWSSSLNCHCFSFIGSIRKAHVSRLRTT